MSMLMNETLLGTRNHDSTWMKGSEPSPYYGANPKISSQGSNINPSRYQNTCSRPPADEYFRVPICCFDCEEIWKSLILEVDAHHSTRGRGPVSNLREIVSRIAHPVSLDKERDSFPGTNYRRNRGSYSSSERNFSRTPSQRGHVPWVGRPHVQGLYPSGRSENLCTQEGGYLPNGNHQGLLEENSSGTSLPDKYESIAQYCRPLRRLEIFSSPEEGSIRVGGHRVLVEENSSGTEMRTKLELITEYSRPSSRSERFFPPGRSNYSNGSHHNLLEKKSGPTFLYNNWRPVSENSQSEIKRSPRPTYNRSYGNRPILLEELGSASPERKTTSLSLTESRFSRSSCPSDKGEKLDASTALSEKASCNRRESQVHSSGEYEMSRISTESKLQTLNCKTNSLRRSSISGSGNHSELAEENTLKHTSTQRKSTSSIPGTISPHERKLETPLEAMSSATSSRIRTGRSRTLLKRSSSRTSTSSTSLSSTTEPVSDTFLSSCRSETLAAGTRSLRGSGSDIGITSQNSLSRTSTQQNSTSSLNEPVLLYSSYSCNLSEDGFSDSSDGETVVANPTYLEPIITNPNYMKRIILPKMEKPTNTS